VNRLLLGATLLAVLLAAPLAAPAQPRGGDDAERAFVESLRGRDPAGAERYVALRDAREQAIAELRRVEAQYAAAGSELRPVFLSQLKEARRMYAARSLAVLDFLDAHDRQTLAEHHEAIGRINALLEARGQARVRLEKLLKDE
jgi:hypothetical protein